MFNKIINHYRIISVFMYMLGKEWNNNNHLLCSFIQININDYLINYNDILWNESIFWATAIIRGRRTINRKKIRRVGGGGRNYSSKKCLLWPWNGCIVSNMRISALVVSHAGSEYALLSLLQSLQNQFDSRVRI